MLFGAAVVAVAAVFAWIAHVRSVEPFGMDQGLFACFGRFVSGGAEGRFPYLGIWDSKPPGILYTWPLAFALAGPSPRGMWLFETLWLAACAVAAGLLAGRLWGRWSGLAAGGLLVAGMWAPGWGGYWARAQAEEFLALFALGAGWFALRAGAHAAEGWGRDRDALVCGLLTGLATLYKVPALAIAGAWVATWLAAGGVRLALRRGLGCAAGIAAVWAAVAAWFGMHGALGAMIEATFTYSSIYAQVIGAGLGAGELVRKFATDVVTTIPGLLVFALAGIGLAIARRDALALPPSADADKVEAAGGTPSGTPGSTAGGTAGGLPRGTAIAVWIASWTALALAAVLVQRQLAGYHYLLAIPPLALAAGAGVGQLVRSGRAIALVTIVALAALGVVQGRAWSSGYRAELAFSSGSISREQYLRAARRGIFEPGEEDALALLAAQRAPAGSTILVWGLSPGVYALADRAPATRFPFHQVFLTDSPLSVRFGDLAERRRVFIEGLEASPPAVIFVGTDDRNFFEPESSDVQLLRFPELRTFVEKGYVEDARVGRFKVYVRKG